MIYLQLFFSFLQIGLFSFGGGYAAMPLTQGQVVTPDHDITDDTGTHCGEFRYFCGNEDRRDSRSYCGYGRMHPAVLRHCDDPGKTIPEVS